MGFMIPERRLGLSLWWITLLTVSILPAWAKTGLAEEDRLRERIGHLRIPFIANCGQTDPAVAYYAPTFAGTVYVTRKGEIVYSLSTPAKETSGSGVGVSGKGARSGWTLTETPVGAMTRPVAEERSATGVSFL